MDHFSTNIPSFSEGMIPTKGIMTKKAINSIKYQILHLIHLPMILLLMNQKLMMAHHLMKNISLLLLHTAFPSSSEAFDSESDNEEIALDPLVDIHSFPDQHHDMVLIEPKFKALVLTGEITEFIVEKGHSLCTICGFPSSGKDV